MDRKRRLKRKARIRKKVFGTASNPRLSIYRGLRSIYVQVINDETSTTLAGMLIKKSNKDGAKELAKQFVGELQEKKITKLTFDRNGFLYHGIVKEFAEALRAESIEI